MYDVCTQITKIAKQNVHFVIVLTPGVDNDEIWLHFIINVCFNGNRLSALAILPTFSAVCV